MDSDEDNDAFFERYRLINNIYTYPNTAHDALSFIQEFDFPKPLRQEDMIMITKAIREAVITGRYYILDFIIRTYNVNINSISYNPDLLEHALHYCGNDPILGSNIEILTKDIDASTDDYIKIINVLITHDHIITEDHINYAKNKCNKILLLLSCCLIIGTWAKIHFLLNTHT